MCAYHMCPAYQDVEARIHWNQGLVFLSMRSGKEHPAGVHIALNPAQAKVLGECLQIAVGQMPVGLVGADCHFFGGLTVEFDGTGDEQEGIVALPVSIHAA